MIQFCRDFPMPISFNAAPPVCEDVLVMSSEVEESLALF